MTELSTRKQLMGYALDFTSYLVSQLEDIDRAILFGSVARGDYDEKSDVDMFIDTKNKKLEGKIAKLTENFYKTEKAKIWKLKGVSREFSVIVGELDSNEWKDLKRAMLSNGIVLYGKYKGDAEKIYQYSVFSFEAIKPESKRVSIYRSLFGFHVGKKKYHGIGQKYNLVKLGKGVIAVPIEYALEIKKLFKENKVTPKIYDIWSDTKVG